MKKRFLQRQAFMASQLLEHHYTLVHWPSTTANRVTLHCFPRHEAAGIAESIK